MSNILSWNINGFRSILKNGYWDEVLARQYDIICFQEAKLSEVQILHEVVPEEYNIYVNFSKEKARNGVIVLSKKIPEKVIYTLGHKQFDEEGRYIKLLYKDFVLINIYMPHGKRDKSQLSYKLEVAGVLEKELKQMLDKNVIVATDFNIAASEIDVCRAEQNYKNIMFTDAERQVVRSICKMGYKDVFREIYPNKVEYTWWTYAFNCRKKNVGWRIDYFFVTEGMLKKIKEVEIQKEQNGSDHCPVMLQIKGE